MQPQMINTSGGATGAEANNSNEAMMKDLFKQKVTEYMSKPSVRKEMK